MLRSFKPTVLKPFCTTENFAAVKDAERVLCWQTFRTSPFFHECARTTQKTIIPCTAKCSALQSVWRLLTMRFHRGSLPKPGIVVLREREKAAHTTVSRRRTMLHLFSYCSPYCSWCRQSWHRCPLRPNYWVYSTRHRHSRRSACQSPCHQWWKKNCKRARKGCRTANLFKQQNSTLPTFSAQHKHRLKFWPLLYFLKEALESKRTISTAEHGLCGAWNNLSTLSLHSNTIEHVPLTFH